MACKSGCQGRAVDCRVPSKSTSPLNDHFLDRGDRLAGVQPLRAGPGAVKDRVAAIEPERVFELVEPFACRLVAAVGQPAIGLEKHGRPEEPIAVPPMARASRRAAKAEDALGVPSSSLLRIFRRLKSLLLRRRRRCLKPRLDSRILREEMRECQAPDP